MEGGEHLRIISIVKLDFDSLIWEESNYKRLETPRILEEIIPPPKKVIIKQTRHIPLDKLI